MVSDDFNNKEAFLDIMANKNTAVFREYALKEYESIDNDSFYKIALRYKIHNLELKRTKALYANPIDKQFLLNLNKLIRELKDELEIPF